MVSGEGISSLPRPKQDQDQSNGLKRTRVHEDMVSGNPIWWTIAVIVAASTALIGVGIFFVRAKNIERRSMVALGTLLGAGVAIYILTFQPVWAGGQDTTIPLLAICISILGFTLGRLADLFMGARSPDKMKRDPATYTADLAD